MSRSVNQNYGVGGEQDGPLGKMLATQPEDLLDPQCACLNAGCGVCA